MGNVVAGNGRKWSGGWEVTNRLYSAVGENSIDFFGKLYRLSGKTLKTFLGNPIDFFPMPPYIPSDNVEATIRLYGTNAAFFR